MQRKLAGYVYSRIYLAQDFLAGFAYEDGRGFLTKKRKGYVVKLNDALKSWIRILSNISTNTQLRRLRQMICPKTEKLDPYTHVPVYVRFTLEGTGEYIGYTEHWEARVKKHWFATCRHRVDGPKKCKNCAEHRRYLKQAPYS